MMNLNELEKYLDAMPGSESGFPFGPEVKVYKVGGKMFALISLQDSPLRINLKCDPMDAQILREQFEAVIPGYHMNKEHWNTVVLDGTMAVDTVRLLIDQSYNLIYNSLPKYKQNQIKRP